MFSLVIKLGIRILDLFLKIVLRTKHYIIYRHNGDDVNVRDDLKLGSYIAFLSVILGRIDRKYNFVIVKIKKIEENTTLSHIMFAL